MLPPEIIKQIPKRTQQHWDHFEHENYFGNDWTKDYVNDFDNIKHVLNSKHLKRAMNAICAMSKGYKDVIKLVSKNKKFMRENAANICFAIRHFKKQSGLKISQVCKLYGVNKDWYYRHRDKTKCVKSHIDKCYQQYSGQLTFEEASEIQKIAENKDNFYKSKISLYYGAMRKGLVYCSRTTFYKYLNIFEFRGFEKNKEKHIKRDGFYASRPFEALHVDITHIPTQNDGMIKCAFVKDNYSKAIIGVKFTIDNANSRFIKNLFKMVFRKHKVLDMTDDIFVISDGGPENKGEFISFIDGIPSPPKITKLIAKTNEFPFSNNASEALHKILKQEFIRDRPIHGMAHFKKLILEFIQYYNKCRYPTDLKGYTPIEVLQGAEPTPKLFSQQIKQRQKERINENRAFNDCPIYKFI